MTHLTFSGRIFRGYYFSTGSGWRPIISDKGGREVWVGKPQPDPDSAFEALKAEAKLRGVDDIKEWGGTYIPPETPEDES